MAERILITGGTGFAGSHLIEFLLSQGEKDIHTTTYSNPDQLIMDWLPVDHIHQVNLLDLTAANELIERLKPTQIYHLAAIAEVSSSFTQAEKILVSNVTLQLNLLEAVRQYAPSCRVLIVGSGQEYDVLRPSFRSNPEPLMEDAPLGPSNPYAVSKVSQDLLGLAYHYSYQLDIVRVRPFNHIGERQTAQFAVASFAQQIAQIEQHQQTELRVGNLSAQRDICDVKDVVRAYHLVMTAGARGEVYNIGSGIPRSMQEILDHLISLSSQEIPVVIDQDRFRPVDIPSITADISKITMLGWSPAIELDVTLRRVLEYWRDQIKVI